MASYTKKEWARQMWSEPCFYCGSPPRNGQNNTLDHIIPQVIVVCHHRLNFVPACPHCNHQKGRTLPHQFGRDSLDKKVRTRDLIIERLAILELEHLNGTGNNINRWPLIQEFRREINRLEKVIRVIKRRKAYYHARAAVQQENNCGT